MPIKIALLGYGQMGKEIEKIASSRGHKITQTFDIGSELKESTPVDNIDVFIEFTEPNTVFENIKKVAALKRPMVIGTTGWFDKLTEVEKLVKQAGIGLIYAANFSIGVNIFYKIVENAATIFNQFDNYDVFIHEIHHKLKQDSPSGTALNLGKIVLDKISRKSDLLTQSVDGKIQTQQLHISSTRAGNVPGTHLVGFDSEADSIELKHAARNRSGFAIGAIHAAEWIIGKKGLYSIDDYLNDILR